MGSPDAGIVGPMGAGGLSLPGVEKAMMDMEGGSVEDMKEKFARLGRRVSQGAYCTSVWRPSDHEIGSDEGWTVVAYGRRREHRQAGQFCAQ